MQNVVVIVSVEVKALCILLEIFFIGIQVMSRLSYDFGVQVIS